MSRRHTIVAHGALLKQELRVEAARSRTTGRQIMTFESLACRLAGGFVHPIDDEVLRDAVQRSLPITELGELDPIKDLPGFVAAAAGTLRKAWRSGLVLQDEAAKNARIASVARLEAAVLERLPPAAKRPIDVVEEATARIGLAETLFGSLRIVGIMELSPCWVRCSWARRTPSGDLGCRAAFRSVLAGHGDCEGRAVRSGEARNRLRQRGKRPP